MPLEVQYLCSRVSQKWVFAVMCFFAHVCTFSMRMCLPLTIPKMIKTMKHTSEHHDDTCPGPNVTFSHNGSSNSVFNDIQSSAYDWSEFTQGIILGSFYWGFVVSHVPGGIMAERYGGKHTLGFGLALTALCSILTPLSITWGDAIGLTLLRVFMGMCEGITQPAVSVMLAQWVPAGERSKITTFVFTGSILGILLISTALGTVLRIMDWQGVYYLFGSLGLLWYLLWLVLCYNNPAEHPFITASEAKSLADKLKEHTHADPPPVPWRHLLSSSSFWALVAATVGRDWSGLILLSDLPKYTMSVLKFTVDENGLLYLLNNLTIILGSLIFSWLADWSIERKYVTRTNARKILATISLAVKASLILLMSHVGCDKTMFIVVSCAVLFAAAAGFPGVKANVLDLSPNYAGTVMAISHGFAGLCGIAGPYVVGVLVPNQTLSEWRLVYRIIFVVCSVANVVFLVFGSGEVQEWNDPNFAGRKKNNNDDKEVEMKEIEKLLNYDRIKIVAKQENEAGC